MKAKPWREVLKRQLQEPEFRELWDKTALARAVAIALVQYRSRHHLSQTELAKTLGVKQPAVARLETGETNPSLETLLRLSEKLGLQFVVDIGPRRRKRPIASDLGHASVVEKVTTADGRFVVAVG